jgi:hypothetical protein
MTATVTSLPSTSFVSTRSEYRLEGAAHTFESALKEVEQAQRSLLMDRLAAQERLAEALRAVEALEASAQRRLDRALLSFHFAGGEPEDLSDFEGLPEQLGEVLSVVSQPVEVEIS